MVPLRVGAPKKGEIYQHYKGDRYKVFELALHSNDDEWMVVDELLYENPDAHLFTRPLREWGERLEWEGRRVRKFSLVDSPSH